jgi:membrane associated rhomboid family serine protease
MSYSSRPYVNRYVPSNRFPVGLKWLLIVNTALFLLHYILHGAGIDILARYLALTPAEVVSPPFAIWQFATYTFIHTGIGTILWNMLALWMFGASLERVWGTTRFLRFYFVAGIVSGVVAFLFALWFHVGFVPLAGSSACVNAILVAYGFMFPDDTVLFGFVIPIKSKYLVMIIGGIVLLQSYSAAVQAPGSGYVIAAHLITGLLMGFLLLRGSKLRIQIKNPLVAGYREWKLQRAKKKFEVYLRKQDSGRNRRVH